MGDAVIVSAARTAIGTARKGSLVDVDAFDLAKYAVQRGAEALGHPGRGRRRHRPGRGAPGRRRHRPLRRRRARHARGPGPRAQPPLRVGHGVGAVRGGEHPRRHGPRGDRRRRREPHAVAAGVQEAKGSYSGVMPWLSPSHRATPEAPDRDMSITVGWNTAQKCNVTPRGAWTTGRTTRTCARSRPPTKAGSTTRSSPSRCRPGQGRARRASSTSTSTRAATPRSRSSPRCRCCTPRSPGSRSPPATRRASTTPSCAMVLVDSDYAAAQRARAARDRAVVGVGRGAAGRHRPRADARDPEGAGARRARHQGRRRWSRSTRRSRRWRSRRAGSSASTHEIVNVNGSGCSLGHPVAATGARMVATLIHELRRRGGGIGVATMCAGGGMGSATVIEVPA